MNPLHIQIIFADLQTRLVESSKTVSPPDLEKAAAVLLEVAQALEIPYLFSVLSEAKGGPLLPSLFSASNLQNTFVRTTTSAFLDDPTVKAVEAHGRKMLVICGFTAEVVVSHSVQHAIERGYQVVLPIDVVGSRSERTERAAIHTMERLGAHVSSVMNLATMLAPDMSKENGRRVMELLLPLRK